MGKLILNGINYSSTGGSSGDVSKLEQQQIYDRFGLSNKTTIFNEDKSIVETATDGSVRTTVFNADGSITETVVCKGNTYIKTTLFNDDGSITESFVKQTSQEDAT